MCTRIIVIIMLIIFGYSANSQNITPTDSLLKASANQFILDWHKNAADADMAYFDKIADDGIYIGTDADELWSKAEFIDWSKKYFDRGKAWDFTTISRNIYVSKDKHLLWFDELLNTGMGVCRASGILRSKNNGWEIVHYHLSMAIPNESVDEIKKIINGK